MADTAEALLEANDLGGPWRLPAVPRSVAELRNRGRDFAVRAGADADVVSAVALAISEAATNAVMHAFVGREPGELTLTCRRGPGELHYLMTDDGRGVEARDDSPGMGMGLATIARVATRLDVRPAASGPGTNVELVFRAPGVCGPSADPAHGADALLVAASDLARGPAVWPQDGVECLCAIVLPAFADASTIDVADHGTLRRLAAIVHDDANLSARLREIAPPLKPGTATWSALRGGGPQLVVHDADVARTPGGPGALLGLAWWLAVPVTDPAGGVLALWGLGGRGRRPVPDTATVVLVEEAARRAAGALANARVLTASRATRHRLDVVLSTLEDAVSLSGPDGALLYANDAGAKLRGEADAARLLARPPVPWADRHRVTTADGATVAPDAGPGHGPPRGTDGEPLLTRNVERRTGTVRWLRTTTRTVAEPDGPVVVDVVHDVTQAVLAEHRSRAMAAAGRLLDQAPGGVAVLKDVAALLVPGIADGCLVDVFSDQREAPPRRVALAGVRPGLDAVPTGLPTLEFVTDAALGLLAGNELEHAALRALGLRSLLVVALRPPGRTLGWLTLIHDDTSGRRFDAGDAQFADDLGRRIGAALAQPVA